MPSLVDICTDWREVTTSLSSPIRTQEAPQVVSGCYPGIWRLHLGFLRTHVGPTHSALCTKPAASAQKHCSKPTGLGPTTAASQYYPSFPLSFTASLQALGSKLCSSFLSMVPWSCSVTSLPGRAASGVWCLGNGRLSFLQK